MVSVGCFFLCYDFKEATHTVYAIISIQSISEVFHELDRPHNWMHFAMASLFVHRDFFWFGFNLKPACFDQTPKFKTMELAAGGILPNITFTETNI